MRNDTNTFEKGDRVVATSQAIDILVGKTGTVTDPDHIGFIMVHLDDEDLKRQALGCFLADELEKLS